MSCELLTHPRFDHAHPSEIRDRTDNVNQRVTKLDAGEERDTSEQVKMNRVNHKFRFETIGRKTRRISRTIATLIPNTGRVFSPSLRRKKCVGLPEFHSHSSSGPEEKKSTCNPRTPLKYS
ncbi:hypothetical protein AVEN_70210-1 [Araneus ventricosus]|uniref:Uncharacterized protein n=1 Tax=Araneus ventricosus TaxID=182803 RepID=A0A4Y2FEF4_ARAVE|nr:hypothetical protein AVEN_70210-1 [Araneus ventricosus]